jgi:tropomyosin
MYCSFREADLRAEQLGKKAVKLELELKAWDKKNGELEEKYLKAKGEMEELEGQLDGI